MTEVRSIATRRLTPDERKELWMWLRIEGWYTAPTTASPTWIAKSGGHIGYGHSRSAALDDLEKERIRDDDG